MALAAAAVGLLALDAAALAGALGRDAEAGPRCGGPASRGVSATPARPGLLWLRLRDRRTTALVTARAKELNHPAVSPDGRLIAFLSHSDGIVARLQICDLARGTTRLVRMDVPAGNFALSWDRDGKRLLFLGGDVLGWGADQRPFAVEPSGKGLRQLAGDAPWYYDGAALSPDGTKLALLLQWKYPHGREPEQLSVLDLRTGRLERAAGSAQVAQIDAVSWSPDGRRLVFTGYRPNDRGGLFLVDLATKRLTPLLVRGAGARAPAWSPDGRSIAFVRGGRAASSIWLLDLRTRRTQRLTTGGVDVAPAWSPDGKALVFVRRARSA